MPNVKETIADLLGIDGAIAAAVVDSSSGMVLSKGGTGVNLDVAAFSNTEVVRATMKTMKQLGIEDKIEDILIILTNRYHVIRPIVDKPGLFVYLVLIKEKANLAMARYRVTEIEAEMSI